jgi:hypothetical protein
MKRRGWSPFLITVMVVCAWASGPKGTVPRSGALKYPAHVEQSGTVSFGGRLLTREEVRKTFVSDLNHCCVVVELAVYPQGNQPFEVSLNDISVKIAGTDTVAKASGAKVLSAVLQKNAQGQRDITISPESTIGYESGNVYDPATGTVRRGGVYTSTGVGVGIGHRGDQPGASDKDRSVMETELNEKALPEGTAKSPVAGYVYFQLSPKNKNAKYQLHYTVDGQQLSMALQ